MKVALREAKPLATLENATRMLAKVSSAHDAKKLMDMADAARFYAKKAGLGEEAELHAYQIKIDAQTMLGAFLKDSPTNKGANGSTVTGSHRVPVKDSTPTLASVGISKKLSSQSKALHTAKEKAPEVHAKVREKKIPVSKVREQLRRPPTEAETEAKALLEVKRFTTRWLEKECAVLNSGCSSKLTASQIDLTLGLYADDPQRKLTPERLRSAGQRLIDIATEWEKL